jgi:hypothetical protein
MTMLGSISGVESGEQSFLIGSQQVMGAVETSNMQGSENKGPSISRKEEEREKERENEDRWRQKRVVRR